MKTIVYLTSSVAAAILLCQCGAPAGPNTQRGAATGGLLGAALGGVVGHQSGRALEGAAIGGVLGGTSGAMYGNAADQDRYYSGY
jgi:uncharacterized protein YcfJ